MAARRAWLRDDPGFDVPIHLHPHSAGLLGALKRGGWRRRNAAAADRCAYVPCARRRRRPARRQVPLPETFPHRPPAAAEGGGGAQVVGVGAPLLASLREQLQQAPRAAPADAAAARQRYHVGTLPAIETPQKDFDYVLIDAASPAAASGHEHEAAAGGIAVTLRWGGAAGAAAARHDTIACRQAAAEPI
jgi:hypothetical protein